MGNSLITTIFKILIKLPAILFVYFLCLNMFLFVTVYFKAVSISNVIMQVAVENNYLPPQEYATLERYVNSLNDIELIDNARIVINDPNNPQPLDALQRRQYGQPVSVGVSMDFVVVWPLKPTEQLQNPDDEFVGYRGFKDGASTQDFASEAELENRRNDAQHRTINNILIVNTVPGLKYYADLS